MNKLQGLQFPANGSKVYQEEWIYDQDSKESEIINRDTDLFDSGIVKGGEIATNASLNSINFTEITIAYDSEGKRIFVPVLNNFTLPANSTFTLVLRHKFNDIPTMNPDGSTVIYKENSYEILTRTGSILPGDVTLRLITTASGVVTISDDLRVWRRIKTEKIGDGQITLEKQNSTVKTGLLLDLASPLVSGISGAVDFAKVLNNFHSIFKSDKKELGEVFFLNDLKAASSDFPALCLAENNKSLFASGNGSNGNFPLLVPHLRSIPLRFDPLNSNLSDFTISEWSFSGNTVTITFAFSASPLTKESKVLRSLHEDAFVHNANSSIGSDYSAFESVVNWRTVTLTQPLRDSADNEIVPVGTYQITAIAGGDSAAGQIKFVVTSTPSGTPKVENRLVKFYPYRIQDSGSNADINAANKCFHFAIQGRGFTSVMDADSECVGGLRRRDRLQGHRALLSPNGSNLYDLSFTSAVIPSSATAPSGAFLFSGSGSRLPLVSDDVNGVPRLGLTTDSRSLTLFPYIWGKSFSV